MNLRAPVLHRLAWGLTYSRMRRKRSGFRNKDARYFEKVGLTKKGLRSFYTNESKRKHGKQLKNTK